MQEVRELYFGGDLQIGFIPFPGNSIDFKNIGYLMNLEKIRFSPIYSMNGYSNIDLKFYDDVLNCKKFTTINSKGISIVIPDMLASSTLNTIQIEYGWSNYSSQKNMPILSKAILEKFNNGLLQISYQNATYREDTYTYETGSDFDIRNLIAPTLLQTMPKLTTSINCFIDKGGHNTYVDWDATSDETFDQFLDRMNQVILEMSKTNKYLYTSIGFSTDDSPSNSVNLILPIVVLKGPIKKDINVTGTTFTGTPVQIIGQIKGKFDNGSTFPDRATIDAQELQIIIDGQTFDSSAIFNMQVTVVDDQITNGLIVGQANNQFFSIIFN